MLSSTLTRPTTLRPSNLLPTSRFERIVTVKETIDIADLPDPISQVIPLDTIHRKPRRTKTTVASQRSESSNPERSQQSSAPTAPGAAISEASDELPQSPSISNVSRASTLSSGMNESENGPERATRQVGTNLDGHSTASSDEAAIAPTATIEMLQSGCLPGDTVSVKLAINLGKHFSNPQGIILTLYRECHIDIHPAIPLGSWQNGSKQEYEDYYPKSRTGLGGLSLSSGGSSRVFRQDISQKSTALYVDRISLTATVKASIHVPDGVFPTISSVPGKMIDFKYYVETIIDLRGKSAIQERILPRLSMVHAASSFSPGESKLDQEGTYDGEKLPMNSGLAFLETSQLRREKGVVTHISEVVVGTRDSRRSRLKKTDHSQDHGEIQMEGFQGYTSPTYDNVDHDAPYIRRFSHYDNEGSNHNYIDGYQYSDAADFAPAHDVTGPDVEDHVDEKTRLQRAEALLLPSAPPQDGEPSSSGYALGQHSAPAAFDDYDFIHDLEQPGPSAPAYDLPPASSHHHGTTSASRDFAADDLEEDLNDDHLEDKQEVEYRRLQAQASSPDVVATGINSDLEASAPVLDEDVGRGHTPQPTREPQQSERLPRYQA